MTMLRATLVLVLVASTMLASPAGAEQSTQVAAVLEVARTRTNPIAYFDEVGQVCLSVPQHEALLRSLQEMRIPAGAQLALVAYSDGIEMRDASWNGVSPCGSWPLPTFLVGHERVAALRAYHVLAVLQKAGIQAAMRTPVILLGTSPDGQPLPVLERAVTITLGRSALGGAQERRVELQWHESGKPPPLENSSIPIIVTPQGSALITPKEGGQPVKQPTRWQHRFGLPAVVFGGAGTVLSIVLATLAGARGNEARGVLAMSQRQELVSQAYGLGIAAASSFVVAAGLTISGSMALRANVCAKESVGRRANESQSLSWFQTALPR